MPPTDDLRREELIALIASLADTNAGLVEANTVLRKRVAELERRLGRNSGNSSLPPSTDDRPGADRAARRAAKPTGRNGASSPAPPAPAASSPTPT